MELELHDAAPVRSAEFQDQMAELWDLEGRSERARRARDLAAAIRARVDRARWWHAASPGSMPAFAKQRWPRGRAALPH